MDIGEQIRRARTEKGLTQAQVSVASGVGIVNVGKIERGEYRSRIDLIQKVADAVGLQVDVDLRVRAA